MSQIVKTIRAAKDPQALGQQMMSQNPAMRRAMQYVKENGGDAKAAAEKLARERGFDLSAVMRGLI